MNKLPMFLIILFSGYAISTTADQLIFDKSFNVKKIEFIFQKAELLSEELKNDLGYKDYPNGILRVTYRPKDMRSVKKYCNWERCKGKYLQLFVNSTLQNKMKSLCYEKGMMVRTTWLNPWLLSTGRDTTVDCIVSKYDYLTGSDFSKNPNSETSIKINKLTINQSSVELSGTQGCNDRYHFLSFNGPVDQDTKEVFERFLLKIPRCIDTDNNTEMPLIIYMNSGGGFLKDGFSIGRLFRKNNIKAVLLNNAKCASSCATAFLGASTRSMKGSSELLFHAPYNIYQSSSGSRSINCQSENLSLKEYYKEMLNNEDGEFLYERTMSYCSRSSGWSINNGAANLFGILSAN